MPAIGYKGWCAGCLLLVLRPDACAEPKAGEEAEVAIAKGVAMKFCWTPPGKATLGSPENEVDRRGNEAERQFASKGFWMGKYEVTQEQWQALMGDNPSSFRPSAEMLMKEGIKDTARFPVESVSWHDCQEFLKKLNERAIIPAVMGKGKFALPHEDEWEYAARGGKGNRQAFHFGSMLNGEKANCDGEIPYGIKTKGPYLQRPAEVGSYERIAPHPWGLCDLHGNVWEWCDSGLGGGRVRKGGGWRDSSIACRSANRIRYWPNDRFDGLGLRVMLKP